MSYTVNSDLWDLCQRVSILEVNSDKHSMRLNKLEGDDKMQKAMADALESSADPIELRDLYQSIRKDYSKVSKVLEMVMDQRDRYVKQLMDTEKKVKEFEENIHNLAKKNQMLRGTIKNHEDRILELEEEVKYHKAFANFGTIKELQERNEKLQKLNDVYTRMIRKNILELNDEDTKSA